MKRRATLLLGAWFIAAAAGAAEQHLTLRLEDGLPGAHAALPITIFVPVTEGKGGVGAATAPFAEYGPYTIDGSGLQASADRVHGKLSGKSRSDVATPVWTIAATIQDGRLRGTASAPAAARAPAVNSRVSGYIDPAVGGAWIVECSLPWTDGGSHANLRADGADLTVCFVVRLRFDAKGGKVVWIGAHDTNARDVQSAKISGPPEAFNAEIVCLASDGETPIELGLRGGRIGRGGIVQASVKSAKGRTKQWQGAATVWAWPDAPGFVGGREQRLENWKHDAQPDPALVAAAVKQSATPIRPVEPGRGEVWQHHALQRQPLRCTAPPVFDIRPLPVAANYRLSVTRILGKPLTLADEPCADPYAALEAVWDKRTLGKFRFQFFVGEQAATAFDAWLRPKGNRDEPCPAWLRPVMQAPRYQVRVFKDKDQGPPLRFTVARPWEPLTEAWGKLAPGAYRLEVQGIDADGKLLGARPWSVPFEKAETFQGPYFSGPARPYREAALKLARWTADHPTLCVLRGHDRHSPPGGGDNGGCQIMFGAVSAGLVRYRLAADPGEREAGLAMAVETGDFLRAACLMRGGVPKCYKEGIANAHLYGVAFLDLYAATKHDRWREAAIMTAQGFADSQLANGTWAEGWKHAEIPANMKPKVPAQQAILDADLIPGIHGPHLYEYDCSEVLWFLGRLRKELASDTFRDCEEKAYRWVMDRSVKEWFWRDQGHHSPCMVPPLRYKGRAPSYFALYLLDCTPADRYDPALVADLMRFCETRHVDWSRPAPATAARVYPTLESTNIREAGSAIWLGSRFALVWAKLGQRTGDRLDGEKARALMDAITHAQHPETGNIDTEMGRQIHFSRFATNAGRCAWNLMTYADVVEAAAGDAEARTK